MGRVRRRKWEPRVIDLDLLLYDLDVVETPDLKVPHPLMHERDFVLRPLAEIARTRRSIRSSGGRWRPASSAGREKKRCPPAAGPAWVSPGLIYGTGRGSL